jgi:hypothetical protein
LVRLALTSYIILSIFKIYIDFFKIQFKGRLSTLFSTDGLRHYLGPLGPRDLYPAKNAGGPTDFIWVCECGVCGAYGQIIKKGSTSRMSDFVLIFFFFENNGSSCHVECQISFLKTVTSLLQNWSSTCIPAINSHCLPLLTAHS